MTNYRSPLLNILQKKSRIYLDGLNEDEIEEKKVRYFVGAVSVSGKQHEKKE